MLRVAAEDKETETPKGSLFALGEFVHKTGHLVQKCYTKLEHCHEIALTLYRRIVKLEAELRDMGKEIDIEMLAKCKLQRLVDNLQERESAHGRAIAEMRICVLAAQRICDEDVWMFLRRLALASNPIRNLVPGGNDSLSAMTSVQNCVWS